MEEVLQEYIDNYLPDLHRVVEYYQSLQGFEEVVSNAACAIRPNNKGGVFMDSHQRRIGKEKCEEGSRVLLGILSEINEFASYEGLYNRINGLANGIDRLGLLWSYDTALRIGFKKNFYPENVYLQSGARKGARTLLNANRIYGRYKEVDVFPELIKESLEPYEIENFLCVGNHEGWF